MSAHGMAILALWLAAMPQLGQIGGTILLCGSAIYYFKRLRSDAVTALEADASGYRLLDRGSWVAVQIEQAMVTTTLTVIQFKRESGRRVALALLPDSMDADDYRRLRVWLRWVKPAAGP